MTKEKVSQNCHVNALQSLQVQIIESELASLLLNLNTTQNLFVIRCFEILMHL
jgi:hypothetical protein